MRRYSEQELCMGAKIPWYLGKAYANYTTLYTYYAFIPLNYFHRWLRSISVWCKHWWWSLERFDHRAMHENWRAGYELGYEYGNKKGWEEARKHLSGMLDAMVEEIRGKYERKSDQPGGEA